MISLMDSIDCTAQRRTWICVAYTEQSIYELLPIYYSHFIKTFLYKLLIFMVSMVHKI